MSYILKPRGFAKSRGRPPNKAVTFFMIRGPSHEEASISQICCLTACHEKLYAVRRRWGDKPRIRDDTAAIALARIRGSDFQQHALASFSIEFGCPLVHSIGEVCQLNLKMGDAKSVARSLRKQKPFLNINTARDWIEFTRAGNKLWVPDGDNQTRTSYSVIFSAHEWTVSIIPKSIATNLLEFQPGRGAPDIHHRAARDWINNTCTGEKHWKPVGDNQTSKSKSDACHSAKWRTGRGMPKRMMVKDKMPLKQPPESYVYFQRFRVWIKTTRVEGFSSKSYRSSQARIRLPEDVFSSANECFCGSVLQFTHLTMGVKIKNNRPIEGCCFAGDWNTFICSWHLLLPMGRDNETKKSSFDEIFPTTEPVGELKKYKFENDYLNINHLFNKRKNFKMN